MAPRRQVAIAQSIQHSLLHSEQKRGWFGSVPAYFYAYYLTFECVRVDLFKALRGTWGIQQGQ
jgi:hypothetical protein